jgi:putative PIN family toxin of toxin-antitoxin system
VSKAVFDANVLVSGYAGPAGTIALLLDHWVAGRFELVVSEVILSEVGRAWTKPYWKARLSSEKIQEIMAFLRNSAEVVPIVVAVHGVASDPDDDVILATAFSANADYLVTGDKPLLAVGYYEGTKIVSPGEFLTILEEMEG